MGVSAYSESDLMAAIAAFERLDIVQLPVSVLDQRVADWSALPEARAFGTLIQARSVLLQGVAVATKSPFSDHPDVARLHERARDAGLSPLALALDFVKAASYLDEVAVGVTSAAELGEIWGLWQAEASQQDWDTLASHDLNLVDPRQWPST